MVLCVDYRVCRSSSSVSILQIRPGWGSAQFAELVTSPRQPEPSFVHKVGPDCQESAVYLTDSPDPTNCIILPNFILEMYVIYVQNSVEIDCMF